MGYLSIVVHIEGIRAEIFGDAFLELGALSVEIEDAHAGTGVDEPVFAEPGMPFQMWGSTKITALFAEPVEPSAIISEVTAYLGLADSPAYSSIHIEERDWVAQTQALSGPIQIGRLWICPSWCEPPAPEIPFVRLDPGMAFGSGSHPTTRLCIAWIDEHISPGMRVIDYGCGSGILAIVAAKAGAGAVIGVDIDPLALAAAQENARLNGVEAVFVGPEASLAPAELVVANILADPLMQLKDHFSSLLPSHGQLVLSGLLAHQAKALIDRYGPEYDLRVFREEEGWVLLVGYKVI